jgi:DHA2 family multidrug resistance protein
MEVLDTSIANVAAAHCRRPGRKPGRSYLGADELPGGQCNHPSGVGLFHYFHRPQAFYMICVTLFGISSALCGLAPSLPLLIFFRVLQGVGGGGLAPSEQAILADTFEPAKRGQAFAVYGLAVVLRAGYRPHAGRLDHRQLRLALDLLHQCARGHLSLFLTSRIVEDPPHIVQEVKKTQKEGPEAGLSWLRAAGAWFRLA